MAGALQQRNREFCCRARCAATRKCPQTSVWLPPRFSLLLWLKKAGSDFSFLLPWSRLLRMAAWPSLVFFFFSWMHFSKMNSETNNTEVWVPARYGYVFVQKWPGLCVNFLCVRILTVVAMKIRGPCICAHYSSVCEYLVWVRLWRSNGVFKSLVFLLNLAPLNIYLKCSILKPTPIPCSSILQSYKEIHNFPQKRCSSPRLNEGPDEACLWCPL